MRKITALVVCLILLALLPLSVLAAATRSFLLQEYDIISTDVYCYGKPLPEGGRLEVSAGSTILEDATLTTMEQAHIPITIYCLVDCATSQSDRMAQQREDLLLTISSLMAPEDSMVLTTVDAVLTEGKPMADKDIRNTAITTIDGQSWYTTLYDGISHAMKTLHTSTSYQTNRCLVILSDGHDDGRSTATADKIHEQIQEAGIPVYSVILDDSISEKELTQHKLFAEASLGGFLSFPERDGISASAAAQQIWHSIKGASAIRIGAQQLQGTETDQQLLIRYESEDTLYEDSILIRAVDLPAMASQAPAETEEDTTATDATEEIDPPETGVPKEDEEEFPLELVLACGIGVVLLGAGIVAFILLRKKPDQEPLDFDTPAPDDVSFHPDLDSLPPDPPFTDPPVHGASGTDIPVIDPIGDVTRPVENRCHVHAVGIMHPEVFADFYLTPNMESSFGRNDTANIILNANDTKLSGCHASFFWDGKMLFVQDNNSRNGTAVNGEVCPPNVWLKVENGAVITAGLYQYRITFHNEGK